LTRDNPQRLHVLPRVWSAPDKLPAVTSAVRRLPAWLVLGAKMTQVLDMARRALPRGNELSN